MKKLWRSLMCLIGRHDWSVVSSSIYHTEVACDHCPWTGSERYIG